MASRISIEDLKTALTVVAERYRRNTLERTYLRGLALRQNALEEVVVELNQRGEN